MEFSSNNSSNFYNPFLKKFLNSETSAVDWIIDTEYDAPLTIPGW